MPKGRCPKNYEDITGRKFGKLKIIKRSYPNGKGFKAMWLCKCDCGKEKIIRGDAIKSGRTKSCGCLVGEWNKNNAPAKLALGLANMRKVILSYKLGAKRRGLKYDLTEEQFKEITQKNCYYCGAKPNNIRNDITLNGHFIYNGLDRIDNSKGYIIDNVVPCCFTCNRRKSSSTLREYKGWIKRSYYTLFKGGD